jgi:hypothetical protein
VDFIINHFASYGQGKPVADMAGELSYISMCGSKEEDRLDGIAPCSMLAKVRVGGVR